MTTAGSTPAASLSTPLSKSLAIPSPASRSARASAADGPSADIAPTDASPQAGQPTNGNGPVTPAHRAGRPALRIFNVKYSPNLGDGLLSECLEQGLIACGANPATASIDLAARVAYSTGSAARSMQMAALGKLPPSLRQLAIRLPLAIQARRRWRPFYDEQLASADAVVIGGGNLLADLDLNFPTKLLLATEATARRKLPAFIYACGVSEHWSPRGIKLMDRALELGTIRKVFVRDGRSANAWNALFGRRFDRPATLVRDPGLLASWRYGVKAPGRHVGRPVIGLNLTSSLALRYHVANAPSEADLDDWYLGLARELVATGNRLVVFTNGSPEDRACSRRLRPALCALGEAVEFADPATPTELTRLIGSFTGLVAFRMHAIIASYSCMVPFLALAWDAKLDSFVQSVGLYNWLCSPTETPPQSAALQLADAIRSGIDPAGHASVLGEAHANIATLHEEIMRTIAR